MIGIAGLFMLVNLILGYMLGKKLTMADMAREAAKEEEENNQGKKKYYGPEYDALSHGMAIGYMILIVFVDILILALMWLFSASW